MSEDESGCWRLRSLTPNVLWSVQNPLWARCLRSDGRHPGESHRVPDEGCRCGIYGLVVDAVPSGQEALAAVRGATGGVLSQAGLILGIAEGSGEVILAQRGWRAEAARVAGLFPPGPFSFLTARILEALATRYEVPIL